MAESPSNFSSEERIRAGESAGLSPQLVPLLNAHREAGYVRYGRPGAQFARPGDLHRLFLGSGLDVPMAEVHVAHDLAVALDLDEMTLGADVFVARSGSSWSVLLTVAGFEKVALRTGLYLPGRISIARQEVEGRSPGLTAMAVVNTRYSLIDAWKESGNQAFLDDCIVREPDGKPAGAWLSDPEHCLQQCALVEAISTALHPLLTGLWTARHQRSSTQAAA